MNKFQKGSADNILIGLIAVFVIAIILIFLFAWPQYKVWQQGRQDRLNYQKHSNPNKLQLRQPRLSLRVRNCVQKQSR